MKRMFHRASSLVHQRRRQFSSTSFGIVGEDFSVVEHTPIFSQVVSKLMLGDSRPKFLLDMTFGSGGHTNLLLDHKPDLVDQIVVCDCDRVSYNEAKELRARNNKVLPIRTKFHKLLNVLLDHGITPGCFDGILIDTGCSTFQWADTKRGFCPNKAGLLDLRYDPCPSVPTASEVLQNITDRDLLRLLRAYSGLGPNVSKYVTNTIIESRYMFHRFQTTQELYEVLKTAARTYCLDKDLDQEREMSSMMMKETLNALKLFVNNDVNELQFAVNQVAKKLLETSNRSLGHDRQFDGRTESGRVLSERSRRHHRSPRRRRPSVLAAMETDLSTAPRIDAGRKDSQSKIAAR